MSDQATEVVQPEEGQGDGGQGAPPYAEYLERIPEELRGDVEPVFKDWDANTTRRFQEHAEERKAWEPYEQAGVRDLTVEDIQWYKQFRDAAGTNPELIRDWYENQFAPAHGLTPQEAAEQQQQASEDNFFAPDTDQFRQLLQGELAPVLEQLEEVKQWREQQEYQARYVEAERFVGGQLEELKQQHPDEFKATDADGRPIAEQVIERFVGQYIDSDPQNAVPRAYQDWLAFRGQIEKGVLQSKVDAPLPAEGGGVAASAPEEIKTLKQAEEIALSRLRESNRA